MRNVMLWLNIHRIYVMGVLGIITWTTAYFSYFQPIIFGWWRRRRPHSWSVDLVGKKAVSRGKTELY